MRGRFLRLDWQPSPFCRMPRSRGRGKSFTSQEDVQRSQWFTCSENYTSGMQVTAGVYADLLSIEEKQLCVSPLMVEISILFTARLPVHYLYFFSVWTGPSSLDTMRSFPCRQSSHQNRNASDSSSWWEVFTRLLCDTYGRRPSEVWPENIENCCNCCFRSVKANFHTYEPDVWLQTNHTWLHDINVPA